MIKLKLIVVAAFLALSTSMASAADISLLGSHSYSGDNRNGLGLKLGDKINGDLGWDVGISRVTKSANAQNRYDAGLTYNVVKFDAATIYARAGGSYLDNQHNGLTPDGYAAYGEVGISIPIIKNVNAFAGVNYQRGQQRVEQFNGTSISTGLQYTF